MDQEFFTNLPSEIIINILARLPIRTIISCKCVCKSWLNLVETYEFVKSHLSKSVLGLAVLQSDRNSKFYKIFEFEDGVDLEHLELHCSLATKLNLPCCGWICGSANGLIFLRNIGLRSDGLFICNPITRDYIELHCPGEFVYSCSLIFTYGFGASKMSGQLKVVRISHGYLYQKTDKLLKVTKFECHVYTLGTGSWRSIVPGGPVEYRFHPDAIGAFLNGNLHWLVFDLNGSPCISCFDLETELFSTFSLHFLPRCGRVLAGLFALGDCLCLCDDTSKEEIDIWLMKEYGDERSWTKEFVISKTLDFPWETFKVVRPIKIFKDVGILIAVDYEFLLYYCSKTKATHKINMFQMHSSIDPILHTSSFLSLKKFAMEEVSSFW